MAGTRIRHLQRYRDIALTLTRHGFGYVVAEMDIFHLLGPAERKRRWASGRTGRKTVGARIREVLQQLGPTFVKLGQIASTRQDLLPESIRSELAKLQDQVEPFPTSQALDIIRSELKQEPEALFRHFGSEPLAAASIGQVYEAVLHTGERTAVKIQRPGIRQTVRTDLEILRNLAAMAETRFTWAKRVQLTRMVQEFAQALTNELNYTIEAQNAERIGKMFRQQRGIRIPKVHLELTTRKVMVMEYAEGTSLSRLDELDRLAVSRSRLARRLLQAVLRQIFIEGFFHADPHPGNLKVLPDETLVFLDFGMVGRLPEELKEPFATLIISLMRQSSSGIIEAILQMGLVPEDVDMQSLRRDVDKLREKYLGVSLSKISMGESVTELLEVAYRHRIRIPPDLALLSKTLVTVEGVVTELDPEISIVRIAEPFGRRLLLERYNPKKLARRLFEEWSQAGDTLLHLPQNALEVMNVIKKARVEVTVPEIETLLTKMDRIGNRLSFAIVLLAFSIIMCGLILGASLNRQAASLWHLPVLEAGALVAFFMVAWLIHSIWKSGRF